MSRFGIIRNFAHLIINKLIKGDIMEKRNKIIVGTVAAIILIIAVTIVLILSGKRGFRDVTVFDFFGSTHVIREGVDIEPVANMSLENGDDVSTEAMSYMKLDLDQSIKVFLEEDSKASLIATGNPNKGLTKIYVYYGSVISNVTDSFAGDPPYAVFAPNAMFTDEGTLFKVSYFLTSDATIESYLEVYDGLVLITPCDMDGTTHPQDSVMVEPLSSAKITTELSSGKTTVEVAPLEVCSLRYEALSFGYDALGAKRAEAKDDDERSILDFEIETINSLPKESELQLEEVAEIEQPEEQEPEEDISIYNCEPGLAAVYKNKLYYAEYMIVKDSPEGLMERDLITGEERCILDRKYSNGFGLVSVQDGILHFVHNTYYGSDYEGDDYKYAMQYDLEQDFLIEDATKPVGSGNYEFLPLVVDDYEYWMDHELYGLTSVTETTLTNGGKVAYGYDSKDQYARTMIYISPEGDEILLSKDVAPHD